MRILSPRDVISRRRVFLGVPASSRPFLCFPLNVNLFSHSRYVPLCGCPPSLGAPCPFSALRCAHMFHRALDHSLSDVVYQPPRLFEFIRCCAFTRTGFCVGLRARLDQTEHHRVGRRGTSWDLRRHRCALETARYAPQSTAGVNVVDAAKGVCVPLRAALCRRRRRRLARKSRARR